MLFRSIVVCGGLYSNVLREVLCRLPPQCRRRRATSQQVKGGYANLRAMDYGTVRSAKLTFKGDKKSHKKKKKNKKDRKRPHSSDEGEDQQEPHQGQGELVPSSSSSEPKKPVPAGWRMAGDAAKLRGCVAIRWSDGRFMGARNSGAVELWKSEDDPVPEPAQVFTLLRASDQGELALKTGYGKFVSPDGTDCRLKATAEAVGPLEYWQPVFQDAKAALLSVARNNFVTACRGELFASVPSVKGENETCEILYEASAADDSESAKKSRITDPKKIARKAGLSREDIRRIEAQGASLYEAILDHRSKGKSDKFCK